MPSSAGASTAPTQDAANVKAPLPMDFMPGGEPPRTRIFVKTITKGRLCSTFARACEYATCNHLTSFSAHSPYGTTLC